MRLRIAVPQILTLACLLFLAGTGVSAAQDLGRLPAELSPWSMFLSADVVVKAVMAGLAVASVVTWTVWIAKSVELIAARRRLQDAFEAISQAGGLGQALAEASGRGGVARSLLRAAAQEWRRSGDALADREGLKERIASHLERIAGASAREIARGAGLLATIGATAPFVGLFGTVWGIMNSFVGISQAKTSNLAIVAPGIAEALLATAAGLFAAIPAVVIYNHFSRQVNGYKALIGDTAAAVLRLVSRDLSLGKGDLATGLNAGE